MPPRAKEDPRLPSLRLVGLLGLIAAVLIYASSLNMPNYSALERLAESLPAGMYLGASNASATPAAHNGVDQHTPYRTSFQSMCPRSAKAIRLVFPHVNKAGGRTIEGTFNPLVTSNSFLSQAPRSRRKLTFELVDGHADYDMLVQRSGCALPSRNCLSNAGKWADVQCTRWIYMMRDPLARTLSAFYTTVGRKAFSPNSLANHFECAEGSKPAKLLQEPTATWEDFAALPLDVRRKACYKNVANLHVKYLDPKRADFATAKTRLQMMDWVGFSEDFDLSMQLLSFDLGIDIDIFTPVFNLNSYPKTNLSERAWEALNDMNRLDVKLYEFARKSLFVPRVANMLRAYKGKWPWDKPAVCDRQLICFDKRRDDAASSWKFGQDPPWLTTMDAGERKENVLCAPEQGCKLSKGTPISRCFASFFIVGSRKGGTTSLYQYITSHPRAKGVLLDRGAQTGETFFFERKSTSLEKSEMPSSLRMQYNEVFRTEFARTGTAFDKRVDVTGESSVGMGPSCYTPRTLKETCGPDVKVIYLLRDPVTRMLSQFAMRQRLHPDKLPPNAEFPEYARMELAQLNAKSGESLKAWLADPSLAPPCAFVTDDRNSIWSGLYVLHLRRWIGHFEPSRIKVVQSEVFFKQPARVTADVYQFLGLQEDLVNISAITATAYNAAPSKPDDLMDAALEQELRDFFAPFNRALAVLLQEHWGITLDLALWRMVDENKEN